MDPGWRSWRDYGNGAALGGLARDDGRPAIRNEDELRLSFRRLHPLLHRSGRLADVTVPTDPATAEIATSPEPSLIPAEPPLPQAEPRQRWRLTFSREPVPADWVGRAVLDAWQESLAGSGLPIATVDGSGDGRARIAFAAPLPAAARGEFELADVWLKERRPLWAVREALADRLPAAHRWIAAEDVWLGEPALAGRVTAADWRIELVGPELDRSRVAVAAEQMMAARSLPRTRVKGSTEKRYDLRLLLDDVVVDPEDRETHSSAVEPADRVIVRVRTRFDPELGAGRPEEVVATMAESAGVALEIAILVRLRLVIAGSAESPDRARVNGPRGAAGLVRSIGVRRG
jgi:hypothetical protein